MKGQLTMCVNGDDGTVSNDVDPREIYRGSHLDADEALDCSIALAYFIKAFAELNTDEQTAWLNAHSVDYRFELGSLAMSWGSGQHIPFYIALTAADVTTDDLDSTLGALDASLKATPFADEEYRNAYDMHLSQPLVEMQREAREGQDEETEEFMTFLTKLVGDKDDFAA